MRRYPAAALPLLMAACMQQQAPSGTPAATGCLMDGSGSLQASLRGALETDLDWRDTQMTCDGDVRPDGQGLRLTIAGPLDDARALRFIFGIDLLDTAAGSAQALPTNLTVLVEGEALMYATRGDDKCAVEGLQRTPLDEHAERVSVRGYCLGPASDLSGETRVLVPTFSFTALVRHMDHESAPAAALDHP